MRTNLIKIFAIILFAVPVALFFAFRATPAIASTAADDPAVAYKAKCAACHTPGATKFYDPAKSDDDHLQAIMKGRKGEKPPYMPAFGEKGMTEDEAKGLAEFMKGLRKTS
jgi:mono/diheme cytochrome c family protein